MYKELNEHASQNNQHKYETYFEFTIGQGKLLALMFQSRTAECHLWHSSVSERKNIITFLCVAARKRQLEQYSVLYNKTITSYASPEWGN